MTTVPRLLVLGAGGMLGHRVWLAAVGAGDRIDTWATVRGRAPVLPPLDPARTLIGIEAGDEAALQGAFARVEPTVVVNAIGVVKQREAAIVDDGMAINGRFPQRLAALCQSAGARLIHISTDCVFSGTRGAYTEDDAPDATDEYGRSKRAGEVQGPGCLTLRLSLIGRELAGATGLVEWFLGRVAAGVHEVPGYTRAVFSGLTTDVVARLIVRVIETQPALDGLWHVAAAPLSKHALLERLAQALHLPVVVVPDERVIIDRSLDGRRFEAAVGWRPPSWDNMVHDLASDAGRYESWRGLRGY